MKSSLRSKLYNWIRERGHVTYGEMAQFTVEEGYKVSTAERRLRGLMSDKDEKGNWQTVEIFPDIRKSKRNTDYIAGYKFGGRPLEAKPRIILEGEKAILIYPKQKEYEEQRKLY